MGSSECALTASEEHAHRPIGDSEGGGDFVIAVAGVAKKQGCRLSLGKDGQGGPDSSPFVGVDRRLGWLVAESSNIASADHLRQYVSASAGSEAVQTAVDDHAREPGGDVSLASLGHGINPQSEQGLLCGVLGFFGVPENTSGETHQTRVMTAEHVGEPNVSERIHHLINTVGRRILTPRLYRARSTTAIVPR
jgi:hypothetical protein